MAVRIASKIWPINPLVTLTLHWAHPLLSIHSFDSVPAGSKPHEYTRLWFSQKNLDTDESTMRLAFPFGGPMI